MGKRSKLPVLLTELTLMLLIFALCAAVCLSIFASVRATSKAGAELGSASVWAQSAAEAYRAAHGDAENARAALGAAETDGGFTLSLSDDWQSAAPGEGVYCLTLTETGENAAAVSVSHCGGETIFSLNVKAVAYG